MSGELKYYKKLARELEKDIEDNDHFQGCAVLILVVLFVIIVGILEYYKQ